MLLVKLNDDLRTGIIAERWLGYLLQHMNHSELEKLLSYYEKIGWISVSAKLKLLSMAAGIKSNAKGTWQVSSRVHLTSLLFIAYLAGQEIPRELYDINAYTKQFIENPESFLSV